MHVYAVYLRDPLSTSCEAWGHGSATHAQAHDLDILNVIEDDLEPQILAQLTLSTKIYRY